MVVAEVQPVPGVVQAYEARYFLAVTEVLDRNPAAAKKSMDDLIAWEQTNLPPDKTTQEGAAAAAAMLEYRIDSLQADLATDAQAKADFRPPCAEFCSSSRPIIRSSVRSSAI